MADGCSAGPEAASDPMGGIEAPLAEALAAPSAATFRQLANSPPFGEYASELLQFQKLSRHMQENSANGRRLMFLSAARMQRSDCEGAKDALRTAEALPSSEVIIGSELWADREKRLRLCEAGNVSWFVQGFIGCRGFLEMLESGVLTPPMPTSLSIGIDDVDDERYLLGTIDAARELERYAVNRGQLLDLHSVQACLGAVQSLEQALMQFNFRNSDLRRRFDGVKYVVKKLETLAYEVDLAKKRGEAAGNASKTDRQDVDSEGGEPLAKKRRAEAAPSSGSRPLAVDLKLLGAIKDRYDAFDSSRELAIKRSRDVIKSAKNAIFALQRDDLRKADGLLKQCARDAESIYKELVAGLPSLRGGSFSAALEEFAEALAYRAFRRDRTLLSRAAMQEASGLSFPLTLLEYLGGLMDLTGEVGRLAVRSASRGRQAVDEVSLCLACVDAVYMGMQDLPFLPGGLGKKMGPLKGTLAKIEGILYELALLSHGGISVTAPACAVLEEECEGGGAGEKTADGTA
uniref:Translin n=1 Tax=Pyrodinium bahamense TaxID=73915 RepID=A0A7S0F9F9_9DINO